MPDLKIDTETGDLAIENGDLVQLTTTNMAELVEQRLKKRLGLFQGEWFLDTRQGVPYFQQILVRHPNMTAIQAVLVREILDTDGVLSLISYSQSLNTAPRSLSVSFSVETEDGPVDLGTALPSVYCTAIYDESVYF